LPKSLRNELAKPFGKIIQKIPTNLISEKTITIGDVTTHKFNLENVNQFLSIIDFNVQRKHEFNTILDLGFKDEKIKKVKNKPGTVSCELFTTVKTLITSKEKNIILVEGEEDLAVIPSVLLSPLDYKIYYGQPNMGLIQIIVNLEIKEKVFDLFQKFELA